MPPFTAQNNLPVSRPRNKKKVVIIGLVVLALVIAGCVAGYWWLQKQAELTKKAAVESASQQVVAQIKDQQAVSRESVYNTPAYDASADQRFKNFRVQAVTAMTSGEWDKVIQFSLDGLAIKGYEKDAGTLSRLADGYGNTGQADNRIKTLRLLKAAYEAAGQTGTQAYKAVVKELG